MRVLFIQDSLGTGGAERSNAELWYFLRKKEVELKVVVLEHRQKGIEKEILENGFDVVFIDHQNIWQQVNNIAEIINDFKPDIVHSVLFRATMRTRLAKFKTKFFHVESLVNCTYDPIRFSDPKVNKWTLHFYQWLDKNTQIKGTDKFIAITNEVKEHYIQKLGISSEKISVVFRGRKENDFIAHQMEIRQKLAEELQFATADIIITHVGRQEFQKGHLELLQAIKSIDSQLSQLKVQFLCCGRDGNNTNEIEAFLSKEKLQTPIRFLGHRQDVNQIMAASDIFVFPSKYEGLGGSLIEAQAAGLPIVCSDIKVFKEVVNKNENALMYQLGNCNDLAEKLLTLIHSETLREKMGQASLVNFHKKFQLESVNLQMLESYRSFLN
ncbi:glycosyltransferase [Flavobacterium sp. XGLA_31]|uniref:glycosyltransferase n=1 Tax=Flavobacterium sp. XGLA_31 TaxID=3447666 RepID=UPI003F2BC129